MSYHRRRGTAIVETEKGILVTAGRRKIFLLPGGGVSRKESRMQAAIRELKEETGLEPYFAIALFRFKGPKHKTHQDFHTVYYIRAQGIARPLHEIKYVAYYTPDSDLRISSSTKEVIDRFYDFKHKNQNVFKKIGNLNYIKK